MSPRRSLVGLGLAVLVAGPLPSGHAAEPAQATAATGVVTRAPELVRFVEASHPASQAGVAGAVVLEVAIDADGAVTDVAVATSGGPEFDAAAVDAVRRFLFTPGEVDGQAAPTHLLYRYVFTIREEAAPPTTAVFVGVVCDADAELPFPGVIVSLHDGQTAVTDAEGRFRFDDVAPGERTVTLSGAGLRGLVTTETFVAGEQLAATYTVTVDGQEEGTEHADYEIVVTAPPLRKVAVSTVVSAGEARKVPGTQGDVLRVVESLPGVARAALGTGALVVWGAAPEDTGVHIDGVRVPRLYHDGGLRSVLGSDFVRSVELTPGGYGAAYGRGLGGLVTVRTRGFGEEGRGLHGAVSADLYDASGAFHGRVSDRVDLGVSGRAGYVGPLLSAFYPGVEDFFPIPHYYDAQARMGFRLRARETLDVSALVSGDATRRTAPSADPAREASEARTLSFQRVWARYARDLGEGTTVSAVIFGGADQESRTARFGQVETSLATDTALGGVRAAYRTRLADWVEVEAGIDAAVSSADVARSGSIAVPSREGDVRVFGQPPPDQIGSDRFRVVHLGVAPYVEADLGLFRDRLHIVPGLRLDPYARSVSRALPAVGDGPTRGLFLKDFRAEPRLMVRYTPRADVHVTGSVGLYGQAPAATDLSSSFGNPALPTARAAHYVVGLGGDPVDTLSIEVTGFYTASEDLAMRNQAEQPARAEALVGSGAGRSYGGQLMVRLDPTRGFYGWISYTLSRSERRDAPERAWRPSDFDQRHVFTALAGVTLPLGFELGARFRLATGFPRTDVIGALYDDRRDLYQPIFGAHNAIRLPTFFQADLRVAKTFHVRRSEVEIYLDVQNVTNMRSTEEILYAADYAERGAIRGLPILPVLGLRWSF